MTDAQVPPGLDRALTPEEVMRPHFPRAVMGYDRTEVDYFLEVVAVQQKRLLERVAELEAQARRPAADAGPGWEGERRLREVLDDAAHVISERRRAHQATSRVPA